MINELGNSSIFNFEMRRFVTKVGLYVALLGGLLWGSCLFLHDPSAKLTILGAQRSKLKQLDCISGKRVILVGGSGCGQGILTSCLAGSLKRPVYNMGIHAGLGVIYQMLAVEQYIRHEDIVVLVPEYANFDGEGCFGEMELLMLVFDIIPEHKSLLSFTHWMHLLPVMPKYGADKIRHCICPRGRKDLSHDYDAYGDRKDLAMPSEHLPFPAASRLSSKDFSIVVIDYIRHFKKVVSDKGASLLLFPPAYQRTSFLRRKSYIMKISDTLDKCGMPFSARPERYALSDELFYDTTYHLNYLGKELRTKLMAEDICRAISDCEK